MEQTDFLEKVKRELSAQELAVARALVYIGDQAVEPPIRALNDPRQYYGHAAIAEVLSQAGRVTEHPPMIRAVIADLGRRYYGHAVIAEVLSGLKSYK